MDNAVQAEESLLAESREIEELLETGESQISDLEDELAIYRSMLARLEGEFAAQEAVCEGIENQISEIRAEIARNVAEFNALMA